MFPIESLALFKENLVIINHIENPTPTERLSWFTARYCSLPLVGMGALFLCLTLSSGLTGRLAQDLGDGGIMVATGHWAVPNDKPGNGIWHPAGLVVIATLLCMMSFYTTTYRSCRALMVEPSNHVAYVPVTAIAFVAVLMALLPIIIRYEAYWHGR